MENSVVYTNVSHCSVGSIIMADFDSEELCLGMVTGVHSDNKSYSYKSSGDVVTRELVDVEWFLLELTGATFPPRSMRLHCEKL